MFPGLMIIEPEDRFYAAPVDFYLALWRTLNIEEDDFAFSGNEGGLLNTSFQLNPKILAVCSPCRGLTLDNIFVDMKSLF